MYLSYHNRVISNILLHCSPRNATSNCLGMTQVRRISPSYTNGREHAFRAKNGRNCPCLWPSNCPCCSSCRSGYIHESTVFKCPLRLAEGNGVGTSTYPPVCSKRRVRTRMCPRNSRFSCSHCSSITIAFLSAAEEARRACSCAALSCVRN
jgi:hypothetical protein